MKGNCPSLVGLSSQGVYPFWEVISLRMHPSGTFLNTELALLMGLALQRLSKHSAP